MATKQAGRDKSDKKRGQKDKKGRDKWVPRKEKKKKK